MSNHYLKLWFYGRIQAWGAHTFETFRPVEVFPTRSGITGLLAAAMGIRKENKTDYLILDRSYKCAVRTETKKKFFDFASGKEGVRPLFPGKKMLDYHTVDNPRRNGDKNKQVTELTEREYLVDQAFSIFLRFNDSKMLEQVAEAVQNPRYALYLGRRNCHPGEDIFKGIVFGKSFKSIALEGCFGGETVYSEEKPEDTRFVMRRIRDVPVARGLFIPRYVYEYVLPDVQSDTSKTGDEFVENVSNPETEVERIA